MKQFQVTEKDGQKWLQPINVPYPNADEYEDDNEPGPFSARADAFIYLERTAPVIYLGSLPVGVLVDESKIREVLQWRRFKEQWLSTNDRLAWEGEMKSFGYETRVAYTDVEQSHDRHISPDKCVAGCTAYHGGEVRHHPDCPFYPESFTRMHDYWKRRAKVAEKLIGLSPSDPKTYGEYCRLFDEWEQLIEEGRNYGN